MKMFGEKSLSVYLFYITRVISIGFGVFLLFFVISLALGMHEFDNNRFVIDIPFTNSSIGGLYKANIIATISITLFLYSLFFYLISLIFQTFKADILFTKSAIKRLNYFVAFNLLGTPLFYAIIHFGIMKHTTYRDLPTYILHILLGVFVLFIIAVFKRGFQVQSENNLTI